MSRLLQSPVVQILERQRLGLATEALSFLGSDPARIPPRQDFRLVVANGALHLMVRRAAFIPPPELNGPDGAAGYFRDNALTDPINFILGHNVLLFDPELNFTIG